MIENSTETTKTAKKKKKGKKRAKNRDYTLWKWVANRIASLHLDDLFALRHTLSVTPEELVDTTDDDLSKIDR